MEIKNIKLPVIITIGVLFIASIFAYFIFTKLPNILSIQPVLPDNSKLYGKWILKSGSVEGKASFSFGSNSEFTIKICNSISGTYSLSADTLEYKLGASTLMACDNSELESYLTEHRKWNIKFSDTDGSFTISNSDNSFTFARILDGSGNNLEGIPTRSTEPEKAPNTDGKMFPEVVPDGTNPHPAVNGSEISYLGDVMVTTKNLKAINKKIMAPVDWKFREHYNNKGQYNYVKNEQEDCYENDYYITDPNNKITLKVNGNQCISDGACGPSLKKVSVIIKTDGTKVLYRIAGAKNTYTYDYGDLFTIKSEVPDTKTASNQIIFENGVTIDGYGSSDNLLKDATGKVVWSSCPAGAFVSVETTDRLNPKMLELIDGIATSFYEF